MGRSISGLCPLVPSHLLMSPQGAKLPLAESLWRILSTYDENSRACVIWYTNAVFS